MLIVSKMVNGFLFSVFRTENPSSHAKELGMRVGFGKEKA